MRNSASFRVVIALLLGSMASCLASGQGLTPSEALHIQAAVGAKRVGDFVQRILNKGTSTIPMTPATPGPSTITPASTLSSSILPSSTPLASTSIVLPSSTPPTLTSTTMMVQPSTPHPSQQYGTASSSSTITTFIPSNTDTPTNPPIDTTSAMLPTTTNLPTSTVPLTSPPSTTPSDKCLRLPSPTACNANMCVTPPNTGAYEFCGCGELNQSVDIEFVGGLTNLTYYTCLRNITGSLSLIDDPDLATLNGLEDLTNIDGAFEISATQVLPNIGSSLPALQTVGDVSISGNSGLTTIDGFNALQTANNIFISSNNNLATINGLNALKSSGNIFVGSNPSLSSVQGFEALSTVNGFLQFTSNDGVTTFDGSSFAALETVAGKFDISTDNNGAAALTSISGFTALTTVDGPFTIQNNLQLQSITGFQALANITTSDVRSRYVSIDSAATLTQARLVDISGLATLAQCGIPNGDFQYSSGDPYLNSIGLKIDVFPPNSVGCTLSTWDNVCGYILYGVC